MSLISGAYTLLHDRRLPYRLAQWVNRLRCSLGFKESTIRRAGLSFRVRLLTSDVNFVENVAVQREYLQNGIDIPVGSTVVDVGGNIGTFACLAAQTARRVIAVEPDPDNIRLLTQNINLNGLKNVTVIAAAVSDHNGPVSLHRAAQGGFHTLMTDRDANADTVTVPSMTLADIFASYQVTRCDLLKLDCEGAEFQILATLPDRVWTLIEQIAMEYHTPRTGDGQKVVDDTIALLKARGFKLLHQEVFPPPFRGGHLFLNLSGSTTRMARGPAPSATGLRDLPDAALSGQPAEAS